MTAAAPERPAEAQPWCVACLSVSPQPKACPACNGEVVLLEIHPQAPDNAKVVAETLRTWRSRQARIQRTDPFMVIPNRTLACLAGAQPERREALRTVPGIGPAKDRDYGFVLARYFAELHAGKADARPALARGPMPEGLTTEEEALVVDLREMEKPLHDLARTHGLPIESLLARIARLVERGVPDVAQRLCAPAEIEWISAHLEAHPGATPEDLRQAFPVCSLAACYLVPALLREAKSS